MTKGLVTNDNMACSLEDNRRRQKQRKRRQSIGRLADNTRAMFDFFFLSSIQSLLSIQTKGSAYSLQVEQVGMMVMSSVEETLVNISLLSSSSPLEKGGIGLDWINPVTPLFSELQGLIPLSGPILVLFGMSITYFWTCWPVKTTLFSLCNFRDASVPSAVSTCFRLDLTVYCTKEP